MESIITENIYQEYRNNLLSGKRQPCSLIVQDLLDRNCDILDLYVNLFQRSLYEVGELWEQNKISVAVEHLATSITSNLMNLVYPTLFTKEKTGKKAVVSCVTNEYHQIGGRMVADIIEIFGWDSYFLGANLPGQDLIHFIEDKNPDLLALSLALHSNMPHLLDLLEEINCRFEHLNVLVGGQAFRWGGKDECSTYPNVRYIENLEKLRLHLI
jgi:methanogenic corrinoid protein MtbC1